MAIQGSGAYAAGSYVSQDLRLPALTVLKPDFTAPISLGGASGQVGGLTIGFFQRLPGSYAGSARPALMGVDVAGTGVFTSTRDLTIRIPHDTFTTTGIRRRLQIFNNAGSGIPLFAGTEGDISSISQFGLSQPGLTMLHVINIGTNAAPVWRAAVSVCSNGGTPETYVAPTAPTTAWLQAVLSSGFSIELIRQIFSAAGTGNARTNPGLALEHVAILRGDFPWDTANNRPHHDAIRALTGSGGNPFLTWQGLVDGANAGTLPYANLRSNGDAINPRSGRMERPWHWTLRDLPSGLINSGSGGTATLQVTAGTTTGFNLESVGTIAPAHWDAAPVIIDPVVRFVGGRGLRPMVRQATYTVGVTTALRRRLRYDVGAVNEGAVPGEVVPGWDWSTNGIVMNAGQATITALAPVGGPYILDLEDANNPALAAVPLTGNIVGTLITLWGQSGAALALATGFSNAPLGPNLLNIPVAAGALGWVMRLDNIDAGGGTYARPVPVMAQLLPGTTPGQSGATNVGHGYVACVNEFAAHNPRHPLGIVNCAINGINMLQWNADELVLGSASWRYRGSKVAPGAASAGGSGVMGYTALLLGGAVDAHAIMWTNVADEQPDRTAWRGHLTSYFDQTPNAPHIGLAPWSGHRNPNDGAATTITRHRTRQLIEEAGNGSSLFAYWPDVVSDATGSLHPAFCATTGNPSSLNPVSDANSVGQGRCGMGIGRAIAAHWDRRIKGFPHHMVIARFANAGRTQIRVFLPVAMRTLNGAALANRWSFSTNRGVTWGVYGQAGHLAGDQVAVTAVLEAGGRTVLLTRASGAWPAVDVRVDYCRDWPFGPAEVANAANVEVACYGLLYDNQVHRGSTNLAQRAGNPLSSSNQIGDGVAGVPVQVSDGIARLYSMIAMTGARAPVVRMRLRADDTILAERPINPPEFTS